ncbi:MAG: LysR family transcriptional regulator, partial [Raoultibacter sp.]
QDFGILLFSRGGHTLQLTEAGQRFAREADRVVAAYRQLQMVAALGNAETFSESEPLRVVTTPFTLLALAPIFDAYRETIQCVDSLVFIEKSAFEIIDEYPHLDKNALYLVNIPTFMTSIVKKTASDFLPLVTSELKLCCSSDHELADRKIITDQDLCGARIACYNEALLIRLVRHVVKHAEDADICMRVSNLELLVQAMDQQHMVSFIDSFSVFLEEQHAITEHRCVIPLERSVFFITGVLGQPENDQALRLLFFFRRYLETVCSDYLKRYPLEGIDDMLDGNDKEMPG